MLKGQILEGSRIARLPTKLRPLALAVRDHVLNPLRARFGRETIADFHHYLDGMATKHNDAFRRTERFQKAYSRSIRATGWDYGVPYRIHQALWCSHQAQKVPGDYVELGTARGFTMSAVLADFENWENSGRACHLFDTFSPAWVDPTSGNRSGRTSPFYAISAEETARNFSQWPRIFVNQGDVLSTLPAYPIAQIAFLHIDLNFFEPEVFALALLWHRIPRGGVVLLDDYAYSGHEKQYDAMNVLSQQLGTAILSTPTGQGIIVK